MEDTIRKISRELSGVACLRAVVLGGSRATGTATETSDIDIGAYYDREALSYDALNEAAARLDDEHRKGLICREGEWGKWVNFGGWLKVDGISVDLIFRDAARVESVVRETDEGRVSCHYQTGHPHAFLNVMYRGELASCRVLFARDDGILALKRRAETYPEALRNALIDFFLFEAGFSCSLAEKGAASGDAYTLMGHLFRAVSGLNQALFALNRRYCLNEKRAVSRADGFPRKPEGYEKRVNALFALAGAAPGDICRALFGLIQETANLCAKDR